MKNTLILLASFFILYSCGNRCDNKDDFSGIVVSIPSDDCFFFDVRENFVIETDGQFLALLDEYSRFECDTPVIDFSQHTLLGAYADGGCKASFQKEVDRDDANQKYIYTVKVKECGLCAALQFSQNFVLVPKLPQNWTVDFVIK